MCVFALLPCLLACLCVCHVPAFWCQDVAEHFKDLIKMQDKELRSLRAEAIEVEIWSPHEKEQNMAGSLGMKLEPRIKEMQGCPSAASSP